MRILKYLFSFSAILALVNCTSNDKDMATYFGGKIINPKSEFVLLYHQDKLIDSLQLDKHDKFIGKYDDFKEGFYTFKHGPEHQYVYIEPQDSILIRLNTWGVFDESLVFSGKGAEKNNLLIDYYLEGEKEYKNHELYSYYSLAPKDFKFKLDSLLHLRKLKIESFVSKNENLPEFYLNILDIVAKYPLYSRFEKYPSYNKHLTKSTSFPETDSTFYSYRKSIDVNNDSLMYLGTYSNYIINSLYNKVHRKGLSNQSSEFTVTLLKTVDENILDENVKNTFLREMLVKDFLNKSSCAINKKAFHTYFKLSSSINDKKQVQRLLNDVKSLHGGNELPKFYVNDYNNNKQSIHKLVKKKNSVIYIWNPRYVEENFLASRIKFLTEKFPKLTFIGVKINEFDVNEPIAGIDIKKQFYIKKESKANQFLSSEIPRTLLINKKGIVINGYATINNNNVLKQLKYLQKQ